MRSDNDGLLMLTSMTPMDGEISIRSDRYPDFFRLLDLRGNNRVLVAEDEGRIVGCVSAARLEVYVDAQPESVDYLGDLKMHPDYQRTGLAVRLLKAMHLRLAAAGADLVVSTAAYGNTNIRPFFDGRAGLPSARALGIFRVYQILPSRRLRMSRSYSVREESECPDMYRLYDDHFRRYQFGSVFRPGSLQGARHMVARSGSDIQAALSLVDVGQARQNVLIRLPFFLGTLASCFRFAHRIIPMANLPYKNEPIRTFYIKALACRDGHDDALDVLIQKARNLAFEDEYHFLAIGVHEKDPMKQRLAKYPKFSFKSLGFVVGLKRSKDELCRLGQGVPYEDYSLV
jgi:GNAT superfamily N-acetyltransferase